MPSHQDAVAISKDLEEASDVNMINFYAQDLKAIGQGARATNLLSDSIIQCFIRVGFLESHRSKRHKLTMKARDFLQNIKNAKTEISTP